MSHRIAVIIGVVYYLYSHGIEWAAAIVGWRSVRRTWHPGYKWLLALATVTVVIETSAFIANVFRFSFDPIYNFWALVETGTLLYIQYLLAIRRTAARWLMTLLVVLVAGTVVCFIIWPIFNQAHLKYLTFNMFVQLIGICVALIDIVQGSTDQLLSRQPAFWLNVGLLFYCSIFIIAHILGLWYLWEAAKYFIFFSLVANTFMYFGFIACFRTLRKGS